MNSESLCETSPPATNSAQRNQQQKRVHHSFWFVFIRSDRAIAHLFVSIALEERPPSAIVDHRLRDVRDAALRERAAHPARGGQSMPSEVLHSRGSQIVKNHPRCAKSRSVLPTPFAGTQSHSAKPLLLPPILRNATNNKNAFITRFGSSLSSQRASDRSPVRLHRPRRKTVIATTSTTTTTKRPCRPDKPPTDRERAASEPISASCSQSATVRTIVDAIHLRIRCRMYDKLATFFCIYGFLVICLLCCEAHDHEHRQ